MFPTNRPELLHAWVLNIGRSSLADGQSACKQAADERANTQGDWHHTQNESIDQIGAWSRGASTAAIAGNATRASRPHEISRR
jgi:hypothetical protein